MKANKTYTQNEKNFTNNLNFLLKNKKNERWKTYQALRGKFEVHHSKTDVKKWEGKGGGVIQQNQGIKQQTRWNIKMKEQSGATRAKIVLQGVIANATQ
jgi:hypothetical protein